MLKKLKVFNKKLMEKDEDDCETEYEHEYKLTLEDNRRDALEKISRDQARTYGYLPYQRYLDGYFFRRPKKGEFK